MVPTKFKKLGPCGGGGGAEKNMDCDGICRIVKITVHHGGNIDSVTALTVRFLRNGLEESTERWGGKGANATEFNLQPTEYITSVKGHVGYYKQWFVVKSLKFGTNLGTFGPYGKEEGMPFELAALGSQIIGFHGRCSSGLLDCLGVYVKVPTKFKKLGPCGGCGGAEKNMYCDGISRIVKITVHHGGTIDSVTALTVRFLRNGLEESTERWGGKGANATELNLQPTEYITSVKGHVGYYKQWFVVKSLKFETNLGTFGPYGKEEGMPFELAALGSQIIGFHGRCSSGLLDCLGVYVKG